jgi:hypothetical protein
MDRSTDRPLVRSTTVGRKTKWDEMEAEVFWQNQDDVLHLGPCSCRAE